MKQTLLEQFIHDTDHLMLTGVVVLQHGEVLAQHHWEPEILLNQYSASKSFTATAVGMAIEEGLVGLHDSVLDYFPEQAPLQPSAELEALTVERLLTMSTGHQNALLMADSRPAMREADWVKFCLSEPFADQPGTRFLYNNAAPYLAGMIVQKRAGCTLVDYLMPRLFEPMGVYHPTWECDPFGFTFGSGGLFYTVSNLAKFGQLYLQNGEWNGRQLISKEWVAAASSAQITTGHRNPNSAEYGYCFWRGPHNSYRADGKYGQYSIVLPDKDAVIAINAYNRTNESILDWVWKDLYPLL